MSDNQEKLNEQLFNVIVDEKASYEARLKKVKYLVRLGADVNAMLYGKSALIKALELQDEEVISFLKSKGAKELVISKEEAKKLSQGFWNDKGDLKSLEEIKELLKKGADLEAKDRYGDTALMRAAYKGQLDVVKCFVELGADLDEKDRVGKTALMIAATWGKSDVVKYLAECGADVEAKDEEGRTALDIAKNRKRDDILKILEELHPKGQPRVVILRGKEKNTTVKKRGIWQRMFGGRD